MITAHEGSGRGADSMLDVLVAACKCYPTQKILHDGTKMNAIDAIKNILGQQPGLLNAGGDRSPLAVAVEQPKDMINTPIIKLLLEHGAEITLAVRGAVHQSRPDIGKLLDQTVQTREQLEQARRGAENIYDMKQGRITKSSKAAAYTNVFRLRNPNQPSSAGLELNYVVDSGATGTLDVPQWALGKLGLQLTGNRERYALAAKGHYVTYDLAKVHVEYTQPDGNLRSKEFTATVRDDINGLPLFGCKAMGALRLTVGEPID